MATKQGVKIKLRRILFGKVTIIILGLLLVYALFGFFAAPYMVERYGPRILEERLNGKVHIGKAHINPFLFIFEAADVKLTDAAGSSIGSFQRLLIDFELSSLFRWAWTFRQIRLDEPLVNVVVGTDGSLNLNQLVTGTGEPSGETAQTESRPLRLLLQSVAVSEGTINIIDRRQSPAANITFRPLNIQLADISTLPDRKGPYTLVATTPGGEAVNWSGEISLQPFRSAGTLAFDYIKTATLLEFAKDRLAVDAPSGTLHFHTDYELDLSGLSPRLTLENFGARVSGLSLKLTGSESPFFSLNELELSGGRLDLAQQQLEIGKAALSGADVLIAVDREGRLNLQRIVRQTAGQRAAPSQTEQNSASKTPAVREESPWAVKLDTLDISETALNYQDLSRVPALDAGLGNVALKLNLEADAGAERLRLRLNGISLDAGKIHVGSPGAPEPPIQVASIVLKDGTLDLSERSLMLARIALEGGHVDLVREAGGEINLAQLLAPPESGEAQGKSEEEPVEGKPWRIAVKEVEMSKISSAIQDYTVKTDGPLLTLNPITLSLSGIDGNSPIEFKTDIQIDSGGSLSAAGKLDPSGPMVESNLNVADVSLTVLQPYIDSVAKLVMHSGILSSQGRLQYGIKTAGARLAYDGGLVLSKLRLTESGFKNTLLGWQSLKTDQLKFRLEPNRLDIKDLVLDRPVGQLIIAEDGSVNLAQVVKKESKAAAAPAGAAPPKAAGGSDFLVGIQKLRVEKGNLDYADLSLTPQFGTKIHELGGVVIGMSSAPDSRAQVQLDGHVDEYGLAKIKGEINLFDPVTFTDIDMIFQNVEMTKLTPYSGKFAGRKIDSGKLSLNLEYKINDGKLMGDNQIVVDRLELGGRVESPEAVDLPLDLAVALLEDANGVIDIGLPVQGDLNDPKFSFGQVIGKALASLITKIVTAPFRVLGALIGGGGEEKFDTVAFEPGSAVVPPPEKEKLAKLAEALQKRPQLKLEVQGRFSAAKDGQALKGLRVRRAVNERLGTTLGPDEDPGPLDYGQPETRQALEALFKDRFGAPELQALEKSLGKEAEQKAASASQPPAAEKAEDPGRLSKALYARLVESEPLPEAVLSGLAENRARAIIAQLTGVGGVDAARLTTGAIKPISKDEPVSAKLSLAVSRKSS